MVLVIKPCFAASYGGLYDVEWCPCDPEERFDEQGSVVLGKTVMCPCSAMYKGYGKESKKGYTPKSKPVNNARGDDPYYSDYSDYSAYEDYTYYIGVEYNKINIKSKNEDLIIAGHDAAGFHEKMISTDKLVDDLDDSFGVVLGMRPHQNMGIELFYNRSIQKNDVKDGPDTYVSKYHAFGVDLIGYLPVTNYFDFIAFAGLGQYYFENSVIYEGIIGYKENKDADDGKEPISGLVKDDAFGRTFAWRLGLGFQFNLGNGVIIRSMYRYVHIDNMNIQKLQEYSVGLRFAF